MSEGLDDFFKLIAEDKKKKKEEFNEMVGDLGLDSLFKDIAEEKRRVKEEKQTQLAKKIEEEKKQKEKFDKIVGDMSLDSLFGDLAKVKKESKEEREREEKVLSSFENFLTNKIDDIEEIKEEVVEEVKPEPEPEPEVSTFVEKSVKTLEEVSDPLTPLDQNFVTLQDLQDHYRKFLVRIQQQLSSLGGGGIEDAPKTGGPYVRQGQKWVVSSGGSSVWEVDSVGISTTKNVGIGTTAKSDYSLYVEGDARITGILTVGQSSVTIDGNDDKIIIGTGTTITEGGNAEFVGVVTATNVSIANTFTYPPHITGGTVPRAIKSQGGYDRSSAFVDYQTGTEASQDPADYIEYTQELADSGTWYRFGMSTAGNQARDNQWWGETNPNYDNTKGLFGGLTDPAGVDHFFDFSENTAFNNAQTTGSLKYTQALGSFSLKECQVGDLVLARFDLNVMPMVTNTTVEIALIYSNRDANDTITFTFPLTITPFTYGSGTVGRGYLLRPTITAYMANQQDVNSRSLLAIKADNPIIVNPIGVLFTIQR